jgi:uncharacterized protein (DUF697 family)
VLKQPEHVKRIVGVLTAKRITSVMTKHVTVVGEHYAGGVLGAGRRESFSSSLISVLLKDLGDIVRGIKRLDNRSTTAYMCSGSRSR